MVLVVLTPFIFIRRRGGTATGSVAALPASIYAHGQSTLPDGRVVVSGSGVTYVYTPSSNVWEVMATVPASFGDHGQSTLVDGRVMVSGGYSSGVLKTAYIYDSDTNMWEETASMERNVSRHGQSALSDGNVFVSGGSTAANSNNAVTNTSIYSVANNSWSSMASLPIRAAWHGQSSLNDGRVIVSGGGNSGVGNLKGVYVYTPSSSDIGTWSSVATLTANFYLHRQSTLFDNRVLISGGGTSTSNFFNTTYLYMLNSNTWTSASMMPASLYSHGQSTLADGRVLISGGSGTGYDGKSAYIYTPAGWKNGKL